MDYGVLDEKRAAEAGCQRPCDVSAPHSIPKQAQGTRHVELVPSTMALRSIFQMESKRWWPADGPMMPLQRGSTDRVQPGQDSEVKTYPLCHYQQRVPIGFIYVEGWAARKDGWASRFSFGITRYVRLAIYPKVRIRDVFVRPSVSKGTLTCEVWLRNDTAVPAKVTLGGQLDAWNGDTWKYPQVPETRVSVAKSKKVSIGPVPWGLGPAVTGGPTNRFAKITGRNTLNLTLGLVEQCWTIAPTVWFVEWTEGPFYYLVNGVRINSIGDGTRARHERYDCYTSPAFLPPTRRNGLPRKLAAVHAHGNLRLSHTPGDADPVHDGHGRRSGLHADPGDRHPRLSGPGLGRHVSPAGCARVGAGLPKSPERLPRVLNEADAQWVGPLADALTTADDSRPIVFRGQRLNHPDGSRAARALTLMP
jgi:hypothetical protein